MRSIQGNYEESLASGREDCNCGYADPRDNHFAEISYRYTAERCSPELKRRMGTLPRRRRVRLGARELLLVHGTLDIRREGLRHLSFGFGTHFCLGAGLARLEARTAFRELTRRFPAMTLASDDVVYRPNPFLRGLQELPVTLG